MAEAIRTRPFLRKEMDKKTKAPQTPFRVAGRSFEQPSPENCSPSAYDAAYPVGIARVG
jgi:hypothetical protein